MTTWGDVIKQGFRDVKEYVDNDYQILIEKFTSLDSRLDAIEAAIAKKPARKDDKK
jgi:hypothetical protein